MQIEKSSDDLTTRAALYAAMLLSAQSRKGNPYKEIKRVYQIFFLNCILFPESNKLPHRYQYLEETEHTRLTEAVEIIFYELPKMEQQVQEAIKRTARLKNLSDDEKWCIFIRYRHEEKAAALIQKLCLEDGGIMHAEKTLSKVSRDYKKFAREMAIMKNSMDRASDIYNARLEGIAVGEAKGLAKGEAAEKAKVAQKMKNAGQPISEITEFTGLSEETINTL